MLRRAWRLRRQRVPAARREERARVPGPVRGADPRPGGGTVYFARSSLEVRVALGGAVFCGWDGAAPVPSHVLASVAPPPDTRTTLEPDTDGGWRVVSERVTVAISRTGAVELRTPGGLLLRRDLPPRWWDPVGREEDAERGGPGTPGAGGRWVQRSQLPPDARVFGLGVRGPVALRRTGDHRLGAPSGETTRFGGGATPARMPLHLVVADAGTHLVFHDTSWDGAVTFWEGEEGEGSGHDRPGRCRVRFDGGPVRYWLLPGPPSRALHLWTVLTGAPALPPRWAFGHQHLLPADAEVRELRDVVDRHLDSGLPLRAVHPDVRPGADQVFDVAAGRLSGLPELADRLGDRGVRLVAAVRGAVRVRPGDAVYEAGRIHDVFVRDARGRQVRLPDAAGAAVYPDFTDPRVRSWWGGLQERLLRQGFAGVWHAGEEPPLLPQRGVSALPASTRHALEGRGGDHREARSLCGLAMNRAAYQGWRRLRPRRRPLVLARSGWAGMQRYGGAWVADTGGGWEGMRAALARVVELGLCGVPFVGVDVGGDGPRRPSPELFLRWLHLGVHLPLLRTRGAYRDGRGEPWEYGERVLPLVRAAWAERERLLPYLVTLAYLAHRSGAPCVRPPWWLTPGDRALRDCEDAFLLGDALLVAPVLAPGVRRREVRLPRGWWYDTATGAVYRGPGRVVAAAPLDRVPVFARAGAVLPVREADGEVVLEVWAPPRGRVGGGLVVSDVGDGWRQPVVERYTVRLVGDEPVVTRDDGAGPDRPVRVRGRGA